MISKVYKFLALYLLWLPVMALAQMGPAPSGDGFTGPAPAGGGVTGPAPAASGGQSGQINNPLQNETLMGLIQAILDVIMIFAVPIIVFFIIYAGFLYVTAQGDATKVGQAHKALLYSVVGGVIILGAQVLISVISGTIAYF